MSSDIFNSIRENVVVNLNSPNSLFMSKLSQQLKVKLNCGSKGIDTRTLEEEEVVGYSID